MTELRRQRVAVVLVTHNGARWLPEFIATLPAALAPAVRAAEASVPVQSFGDAVAGTDPVISPSAPHAQPLSDPTLRLSVVGASAEPSQSALTSDTAAAQFWNESPVDSWAALWGDDDPAPIHRPAADVLVDPVFIAVDTGSSDGSADLIASAGFTVLAAEPSTPFGRAVSIARSYLDQHGIEVSWLWLVHDDIAAHPGCLPELLAAAIEESAAVCGPMVVGWSQPPRLLERGIRLTSSGRRVLGVDPGEVDQGQHDDEPATATLAVSSTAMLVRIDAWDQLNGYDPAFPMSGDDIDFCRRAHRAGLKVLAVPRAKVRHAQALIRNRRPESRSTRPVRDLRLAALHLHLAHATRWAFPLVAVRMTVGTGLRAVARFLRRDFAGARDEVDGWLRFIAHPSRLVASRHRVAAAGTMSHRVERAHAVPLREQGRHWFRSLAHLLEFATRVTDRPEEHGIFLEEETISRPVRVEVWRRLIHRPQVLVPVAIGVVIALWSVPLLFASAPIRGGLLPGSGESSLDLWRSYLSGWHDVGRGSTAAAPAWTVLLAALAVPFGGNVSAALAALFVFFPVLTAVVVIAVSRPLVRSSWVRAILGVTYGTLPVFSHARDIGDLATLVCGLLLPVLVRVLWAAVDSANIGRYASATLLLSVVCAYTPMVWLLTLVAVLVAAVLVSGMRTRATARGLALVMAGPWLLLLPASLEWIRHPYLLVMPGGAVQELGSGAGAAASLLTLSVAQPQWSTAAIVLVALAATARGASHGFTRNLGVLAIVPVVAVIAIDHVMFRVPGLTSATQANPSPAMALIALVALTSIATAADGLLGGLRDRGLGLRHVVSAIATFGVLASTSVGLWTWISAPHSTLTRAQMSDLPAFIAADLESEQRPRALTMRVDDPRPVAFAVRSAPNTRYGDADLLRVGAADTALEEAVTNLIAQGEQSTATRSAAVLTLVDAGVRYVALVGSGSGATAVAATLVAVPGVRQLATPQADQQWWVWQLPRKPSRATATPLVSGAQETSGPLVEFTISSDVDPGRLEVLAAGSGEPALSAATIRIADATDGWRAVVDGRSIELARTASGTWVLDLPGGARNSIVIERVDRSRATWLTVQAGLLLVVVAWALPTRRRSPIEEDGDA